MPRQSMQFRKIPQPERYAVETMNPAQTANAYLYETLMQIEDVQEAGAQSAEDIAEALNRSGFATWHGCQWDAEKVLALLSSPDVERARQALDCAK